MTLFYLGTLLFRDSPKSVSRRMLLSVIESYIVHRESGKI